MLQAPKPFRDNNNVNILSGKGSDLYTTEFQINDVKLNVRNVLTKVIHKFLET